MTRVVFVSSSLSSFFMEFELLKAFFPVPAQTKTLFADSSV